MLRDVKAASTVDKRKLLEIQKGNSSSKSRSEEIIKSPTAEAAPSVTSPTAPALAQSRKAYYETWDKFDVVGFDCIGCKLYTGRIDVFTGC